MFEAPLRIAFPDDHVPAINDCWYHSRVTDEVGHGIPNGPGFYEIAAGWYGAPEFEAVLARAYRTMSRGNVESLLYGPDDVSDAAAPPLVETNEAASGFAVLRPELPEGFAGELLLKYGPHGGGHGHADKLALSHLRRRPALERRPGYAGLRHCHQRFVVPPHAEPFGRSCSKARRSPRLRARPSGTGP